MALQELVQTKLDLEHKWAKKALTSEREEMKWIDIKIKDVKKLVDNEIEQGEKFSIAT
jgi:hypothetical protein